MVGYALLTTLQRLREDNGRVSSITTLSPVTMSGVSLWARYFALTAYRLPYFGWMTVRSTRTATVFIILVDVTVPIKRRRRVCVVAFVILLLTVVQFGEHAGDVLADLADFPHIFYLVHGTLEAEGVEGRTLLKHECFEFFLFLSLKIFVLHRLCAGNDLRLQRQLVGCQTEGFSRNVW